MRFAMRVLRDAACCWKCGSTWSNIGALAAAFLMAPGKSRDKRRIAFSCFPNKACAHLVQFPKVLPSWAKPRPIPFLLIALLSCCGFTAKTVPVSPAKSSHGRLQPCATASRQCTSKTAPYQAPALRFHREGLRPPRQNPQASMPLNCLDSPAQANSATPCGLPEKICDFPGQILWLHSVLYQAFRNLTRKTTAPMKTASFSRKLSKPLRSS